VDHAASYKIFSSSDERVKTNDSETPMFTGFYSARVFLLCKEAQAALSIVYREKDASRVYRCTRETESQNLPAGLEDAQVPR